MTLKCFFTFQILLLMGLNFKMEAQEMSRFYGGLKAGLNLAQIDGDGLYGYNRFGLNTGIFGAAYLGSKTEFQIEFLYNVRGSHYSERDGKILAYKLNYLDVPLIFSYKDWFRESDKANYFKVHFQGGLYVGKLVSSSSIDQAMFDKTFKKTDFGWLLGFSYFQTVHWGFNGRFTQSVIPLAKYTNQQGEELKMISYFISLGLIYRFN
ncbi:MAG: porin family protein [Saprospiraceae bacterium]